jgi:ATP-dependent Clp protease ATP-binding subunit ClpB
VTRETAPDAIDNLRRRKLELEVEIRALERETDQASTERLQVARKAISQVNEELGPLIAAYENEKSRGDEINNLRKRIDELKVKIDEGKRRYATPLLHDAILNNG